MKLGDKISKVIEHVEIDKRERGFRKMKSAIGEVVYIHPKGRFFTVEFTFAGGKYRESYYPNSM